MVFAANPAASSWNGAGTGDPGFLESLASASGMPAPMIGQPLPLLGATSAREPAGGVHTSQVVADPSPALKRFDPGHPDAGPDGYVAYPDINPLTEMVDPHGGDACIWPEWFCGSGREGHDYGRAGDCEDLVVRNKSRAEEWQRGSRRAAAGFAGSGASAGHAS